VDPTLEEKGKTMSRLQIEAITVHDANGQPYQLADACFDIEGIKRLRAELDAGRAKSAALRADNQRLLDELAMLRLRDEDTDKAGAEIAKLVALRAEKKRLEDHLFALGEMDKPPCFCCGYNGPKYYQPSVHSCAARHHAAIAAARKETKP
jgi:hypothetical protein